MFHEGMDRLQNTKSHFYHLLLQKRVKCDNKAIYVLRQKQTRRNYFSVCKLFVTFAFENLMSGN